MMDDDTFSLYNLEVSVVGDPKTYVCSHKAGYAFSVIGENIVFKEGTEFSMYALSALLPLLPVKQRKTHPNDWITSDENIACPDPHCGAQFVIARQSIETFHHAAVTKVPLPLAEDMS